MNFGKFKRTLGLTLASVAALGLVATSVAPAQAATTTITWLTDNTPSATKAAQGIVAAFQKANPNIKVTLTTRPDGAEGDNVVKTKLATKTMENVFTYNSGALLAALNPSRTLVDLKNEAFMSSVLPSFQSAVTSKGSVVGVPFGTAMGGGIYYNIPAFKAAGIKGTPKTWNQLISAARKLKANGVDAICGTFADSWTAQLFVLADYHNVQTVNPRFAADFTANKIKLAKNPAALKGFQRLEQVKRLGLYNSDANTATYNDGIARIASGKCGMYPMLTFATSAIPVANQKDVGFMAQPGDSATSYGLTTWMPAAAYISATTTGAKLTASKKLLAFIASKAGTDAYAKANGYEGPFLVTNQSKAPASVPRATKDLAALVSGKTTPALEFLSAVKGPNLPSILVQIASGQVSAVEGAKLYDKDVVAQARQLGLRGCLLYTSDAADE